MSKYTREEIAIAVLPTFLADQLANRISKDMQVGECMVMAYGYAINMADTFILNAERTEAEAKVLK